MPLTRIDSAFLDLDALGGIDFDVQSGVPTLKVDASTHRVGIGINSPAQKLDVAGSINISSGSNYLIDGSQMSTANIAENSSYLYHTSARAISAVTGSALNMGSNNITTTGKILFANMYSAEGDLPSASTYHGMFAHVHGTEKAYFAHGGNWIKLLDENGGSIGSLNIDGNVSSTTQFSGFDALRIHNANGASFGITADMYFTVGTATANRGAAIGAEYSTSTGNDLYFATNPGSVTNSDTLEERLRITSDGKIGVNNNAPLYAMHFKNAMGSSPSFIHMEVTGSNTVGGGGGIAFDTSASNALSNNGLYLATIAGIRNSEDNGSNDLVFSTTKSGVAGDDGNTHSPKERMRIGSDGVLYLGPHKTSTTADNVPYEIRVAPYGWSNSQDIAAISMGNHSGSTGNDDGQIVFKTAHNVHSTNNGLVERMRVTDQGFVNIGGDYTQESYRAQITGDLLIQKSQAAYQHPQIELYATSDTAHGGAIKFSGKINGSKYQQALIRTYGGSSNAGGALGFHTGDGTEYLRIRSDGIVETGTAINGAGFDGNQRLRVGRANDCNIAIRATGDTTSSTGIDFGDSGDDRAGRIQYKHDGDYMSFHTNGAGSGDSNERLRIESTGSFHIPWADKRLIVEFSHDYRQGVHFDVNNRNLKLFSTSGSGGGGGDITFFTRQSSSSGNTDYGTEKLRLTKDGKLILSGTQRTTPFISGDGGMCIEQSYDGNLRALTIRNKDTAAGAATSLAFSLNRSGGDYDFLGGEIKVIKEQTWTTAPSTVDSAMVFSIVQNESFKETFRLKSSGEAQFTPEGATTSPNASFDTSGDNFRIKAKKDGTDGIGFIIETQASGGTLEERIRCATNGKVGINESSPTRTLSINGDVNIQSGSRIESYSSGGNLIIQGGSTYPGGHIQMYGGTGGDKITFNTVGGASTSQREQMRINNTSVRTGGGSNTGNNGYVPLVFTSANLVGAYRHGTSTRFIGQICPANSGNSYLHVKIDVPGGAMFWIHSWGYMYGAASFHNSQGVGYFYGSNIINTTTSDLNSNYPLHIYRTTDSELGLRIYTGHGVSNAWGFHAFEGGFDGISGNQTDHVMRILAYTWSSSSANQY